MKERVLVAMSGGVDSAVAAALLVQQGYEVIGVTLRLYTEPDDTALRSGRTCCGIEDIGDAKAAAQQIGIPHYVLNMEQEFEKHVLTPFVESYVDGQEYKFNVTDKTQWKEYGKIPARYNRLVLFRSNRWHSYGKGFGLCPPLTIR